MPVTPPTAFESNRAPCEMCGGHQGDLWETDATKIRYVAILPRIDEPHRVWTICDECHNGLVGCFQDFAAAKAAGEI
jgi:hypothetical protein